MPTNWDAHIDAFLPEDGFAGTLVGRVWRPDGAVLGRLGPGERRGRHHECRSNDVGSHQCKNPCALANADGENLGNWRAIAANSVAGQQDNTKPWFRRQATCRRTRHVA